MCHVSLLDLLVEQRCDSSLTNRYQFVTDRRSDHESADFANVRTHRSRGATGGLAFSTRIVSDDERIAELSMFARAKLELMLLPVELDDVGGAVDQSAAGESYIDRTDRVAGELFEPGGPNASTQTTRTCAYRSLSAKRATQHDTQPGVDRRAVERTCRLKFGTCPPEDRSRTTICGTVRPRNRSNGALAGTRTPNLLIRSQMLYPLSYQCK